VSPAVESTSMTASGSSVASPPRSERLPAAVEPLSPTAGRWRVQTEVPDLTGSLVPEGRRGFVPREPAVVAAVRGWVPRGQAAFAFVEFPGRGGPAAGHNAIQHPIARKSTAGTELFMLRLWRADRLSG